MYLSLRNIGCTALPNARQDISQALRRHRLIKILAWRDIISRYQRSRIGVFWITISMAVMTTVIGVLFGALFNAPLEHFLPYLTIGLIIWGLLLANITESSVCFISSGDIILHTKMPFFTHLGRVVLRNLIILVHNAVILIPLYLIFPWTISPATILVLPGLALFILATLPMMLVNSIVATRFRDMPQIVNNAMQIIFYLTAIMWQPQQISGELGNILVEFNPFYHLICIVRSPMLGEFPTLENWGVSVLFCLVGWAIALPFFDRYRNRIPYWL